MSYDHHKKRLEERESEQMSANLKIAVWERDPEKRDEYSKRLPDRVPVESLAAKKSFHDEARTDGTLSADWRCITENISPMVKRGGVVVDLGGNSGRYAEFLAKSRADVKVIAIEPDPEKFKLAQDELRKNPLLADRVQLINKPVVEALDDIRKGGQRVDLVASIYRTHLQTDKQNYADFDAVGRLVKSTGASVLTMDLHRARRHETAEIMPKVFPDDRASSEFRQGYEAALKYGAYRGTELEGVLNAFVGVGGWKHHVAGTVGQMQMHVRSGLNDAKGNAPSPIYPATSPEYVKIGDQMNMIMKVGDKFDIAADALVVMDGLRKSVDSVLSGTGLSTVFSKTAEGNARPSLDPIAEPASPVGSPFQKQAFSEPKR